MRRFLLAGLVAVSAVAWADTTVTFIHTNDLHAHVEPVKVKGQDLGGYARQATVIKRLKASAVNPLVLNGGDTFQGTLYFNVYKGMADAAFMNAVGYQAMAVGNHEFDLGPSALADFARAVDFPILAANLDLENEPALKGLIKASTVLEAGGVKVGIVGAVTPELPQISNIGDNVRLKPLVESVQAEVDALSSQGIDKIVLVSHCGYGLEKQVATKLRGVDMVVGGHTHTFLGDTKLPGDLRSGGPYPTVVKGADGATVLVVQSWEWGKVVGHIVVTFDDGGKVKAWSKDQPTAVTSDVPEDPLVRSMVAALRKPIEELMTKDVGRTKADVPKSGPGAQGVMADMITDAMLEATVKQGSVVALMNEGGIRSALNAGRITYGDAISVQPFNNTLTIVDLTGQELKEALESGVLFVSAGTSFTVRSGKVSDLVVAGRPVELEKTYRCTFNSFVAKGGDGLEVVKNAKGYRYDTGLLDIDALLDYLKSKGEIDLKPQNRIRRG
ncbi:MAG: 5'-nucleotidase C-terminal domain-containing protein [Armatimonadetes bacterium]|nr:5'-nucleotidase C-terminal domain-containing protein [Armatimonadota bacterium]